MVTIIILKVLLYNTIMYGHVLNGKTPPLSSEFNRTVKFVDLLLFATDNIPNYSHILFPYIISFTLYAHIFRHKLHQIVHMQIVNNI